MFGLEPPSSTTAPNLASLRLRVLDAFTRWRQEADNYSEVSGDLPRLIGDVEGAPNWFRSPGEEGQRRDSLSIAALLYIFLGCWFQEIKRYDLCMLAADRSVRAAEGAGDDKLLCATQFRMAHALLAADEKEGAEEMALRVAEGLKFAADRDSLGLYGALNLVAAMAACRAGDLSEARQRIREEALPAARKTGEADSYWTSFGPSNAAVYAMTVETERGDSRAAIALGDQVEVERLPTIIRKANFYLDLGKAHERERDDLGLFFYLSQLEGVAPEWARYNPVVRNLVRTLAKRARPSHAHQFRAMARRLRVVV